MYCIDLSTAIMLYFKILLMYTICISISSNKIMYKKVTVCGIEMCRGCEYENVSTRTNKEMFVVGLVLVVILLVVISR